MTPLRRLTKAGQDAWRDWIEEGKGGRPPKDLIDGPEWTEPFGTQRIDVDEARPFLDRMAFGRYLRDLLSVWDGRELLSSVNDGLWDWLAVIYYDQIGRRRLKPWHYVVCRQGYKSDLSYRHLVRSAFEMVWWHGENAAVLLSGKPMDGWGELAEQLTSRQDIALHRPLIGMACKLYLNPDGRPKRGAAARVPSAGKRRPGDRRGRGGVARLALAVRRLSMTYDTLGMQPDQLLGLLPREFDRFLPDSTSSGSGSSEGGSTAANL